MRRARQRRRHRPVDRLPVALLALALAGCEEPPAEPPTPADDAEVPFPIAEIPLTGHVDPMLGTGGPGNTIPGALVPHGMVRASPDTVGDAGDVDAYDWGGDRIEGFSHTHLEGPGGGANGYSQLLLLPQTGDRVIDRGARPSAFEHSSEVARPGYYAVTLDDYGVRSELTATSHAAVHRHTFPAGPARFLLDLGHSLGDSTGGLVAIDGRTWSGRASYNVHPAAALFTGNDGATAYVTLYFHVELGVTPTSTGVFVGAGDDPDVNEGATEGFGRDLGAWAEFDLAEETAIEVRVGVSLISEAQAAANLAAEVGDRDFDAVAAAADATWNTALNRVQVEGDEDLLGVFYTALYRTFFQPADYTEANGQFVVGASGAPVVRPADGFRYFTDDWCMWDTFRTSHPWATLVEPELRDDVITSMLVHYEEGGWLPKCTWNATGYSRVMIGNHAVPIIADAWIKGLDRFDAELAWEAVDHAGTDEIEDLPAVGCGYVNLGTPPEYIELGYVPSECDTTQSVSMTLEHAYDDWTAARFAEALGRTADAQRYDDRAEYWRNHWNPEHGFMQARGRDGAWVEPFDPTDDSDFNDFAEADSWIYSWFVPHDVPALVEAMGGQAAFVERLDAFFADGHFDPSNQPSFHVPWLYAAAGAPAGTQERVRLISDSDYGSGPDGLPGNDDAGSTSAWLVLSMLGIYPIAPGDGVWTLTAPRFQRATLHLHPGYYDGGTVVIEVVGDPETEPYIQSMTWNDEPITEPRIDHATLVEGGVLEVVVGPEPSDWGG